MFLAVSGFVSPLLAVSRPKFRYSSVPNKQEREGGFINSRVFQKLISIHYFDFGKLKPSFSPLNSDLRLEWERFSRGVLFSQTIDL